MQNSSSPNLLLATVTLLIGCLAFSPAFGKTKEFDPSKGTLLLATTFIETRGLNAVWFYYKKEGKKKEHRIDANQRAPGDYENYGVKGGLHAIPLEPGTYQLTNWTIFRNNGLGYSHIYPAKPPPPLSFEVKAGVVTYIGDLHFQVSKGRNLLGIPLASGGKPISKDFFARDYSTMKKKFPKLSKWPIVNQTIDLSGWDNANQDQSPDANPESAPR